MQSIIAVAAFAGLASAWGNYSTTGTAAGHHAYTTVVTVDVTEYTTYCPEPTEIVEQDVTYTATAEQIITVNNCPCKHEVTTVLTPGVPATSTKYYTTTAVVESYTTICPESTVITIPGPTSTATYTASAKETITVTNGPFTRPTPVPTQVVYTPGPAPPAAVSPPSAPKAPSAAPISPTTATSAPIFTGAANKNAVGFSMGGALGLLAYFL